MIKYLGSKRTLVPAISAIAEAVGAATAVDLFTGTTRVAQDFKRRGIDVIATDIATYSEVLAKCYIATDADTVDQAELLAELAELNALAGRRGYFTQTFCEASRYLQPKNGARVDAIRDRIQERHAGTALYPVLLTALLLAADRVDSTTGLQMAYLKQWAPRASQDLQLRCPDLLAGAGSAVRGDAQELVDTLPFVDLAYLDPPYNQHRYFTNYHVWETLVRWDSPPHYGVACKRIDSREESTKSVFNKKREMPAALRSILGRVRARVVMLSYNNESWLPPQELVDALLQGGHEEVAVLGFDSRRYIGAQIGVYSPAGLKVGTTSHVRNTEYLFVAGSRQDVAAARAAAEHLATQPRVPVSTAKA